MTYLTKAKLDVTKFNTVSSEVSILGGMVAMRTTTRGREEHSLPFCEKQFNTLPKAESKFQKTCCNIVYESDVLDEREIMEDGLIWQVAKR